MRATRAFLVGLVMASAPSAGVAGAGCEPGSLTVEATPAQVSSTSGVAVLRVVNGGAAPVTQVALKVAVPSSPTVILEKSVLGTIPPGSSVLVNLTLTGLPGIAVVEAVGRSCAIPITAMTAVDLLAMAPHTIALVGNTRLTERSPAELRVVVTNTSDVTVHVTLSADAGKHNARLDKASFDLQPRSITDVGLTVRSSGALRRGTVGVVVRADMTAGQTQHIVASRELTVALASDELPGPLGVSSMIVLPGLIALLVFFEILARDRKRIGAAHPGAKTVWDDKTWLLLAGGLSLIAAFVYAAVVGRDVLDTYEISDVAVLTVVAGGLGAAAGRARVVGHRRRVPVITSQSSPADVLRAAQRSSNNFQRKRYKIADDRHGLLVHRDGTSLVLTPPINYESGGDVFRAWTDTADVDRFQKTVAALTPDFDGYFAPQEGDISAPMAVDEAVEVGHGELLDCP